jgi:peptide deformylase
MDAESKNFLVRFMKIVLYPHPALRRATRPLTSIDKKVQLQVREMFDLMYDARGLGLAANQVALPYQVLVINLSADPLQPEREEVYINPVVVERKGSQEEEEGCLSFPGLFQKVRRAKSVKVRAYNLKGESVEVSASDLAARVLQHEIDHLAGVLYIDKMGPIAKLASRGTLRDFERDFIKAQDRAEIPADKDLQHVLEELAAEASSQSAAGSPA